MNTENSITPGGCLLSNGRYFMSITAAGTGQSRRHAYVVNRWLEDPVEDAHGQFIYLRDLETGEVWSAAMQPVLHPKQQSRASSSPGQLHLWQSCEGIESHLDVVVSVDDDLEIRRLRLNNLSGCKRRIEVTSYFEAVLNWQAADLGHPAFSKLFLQTEFLKEQGALVVKRRPRANSETWPCLFHVLCGAEVREWETDRLRFLGRGRTAARPAALDGKLSGTTGNVLDPCCSLRTVIELGVDEEREFHYLTGIAETTAAVITAAKRYREPAAVVKAFDNAATAEQNLRREQGISDAQAEQFQQLATAMRYGDRTLVPAPAVLPTDADINALFGRFPIPRDRPQVALIGNWKSTAAGELLAARRYWNTKGFYTNLLVLTDSNSPAPTGLDDRVFTLNVDELSNVEQNLILATVSLVVHDALPNLKPTGEVPAEPASSKGVILSVAQQELRPLEDSQETLQFFNGYGGFSSDGTEYVIRLPWKGDGWKRPPLPWINVIANEQAGFLVSESGAGCTWARNSQANRLTPWSNEPASDPHGEAFYLRDEETGAVWSPLPGPALSPCDFEVRHGFGSSRFLSKCNGIQQTVTLFVPRHDPVKIVWIELKNESDQERRLSLTAYQQLILGSLPQRPSLIVTSQSNDGSLRASNLAAGDFLGGIAFTDMTITGVKTESRGFTCDRLAFLGRHGTPANPGALREGQQLDSRAGAGLDPCFAQQRTFTIPAGGTVNCVVVLGETQSEESAATLAERYRDLTTVRAALSEIQTFWKTLLGGVQIETPSPVLNLMVNGWLAYQTLCCRMWARTAFYQSSGAFGFRDQLQDAGSLLPLDPEFAREQILLHARHQFVDGDVLHWWHPEPIERGLRTHFSDDLLWLPLGTADYVRTTGDVEFLNSEISFLTAELVPPGEDEVYLTPEVSGSGSLYDHCCRAIDRSLATGEHGLPLMGTGDWNDGMNRVGRLGRGESVWMGFFLYHILGKFVPLCEQRGDADRAARYTKHRKELFDALNAGGWDGEWYRRAYYDNGDPLGSKICDECSIDALAQAWAVISGAAPPERVESSMAAMSRELISEPEGLIRLLTPPFVNTPNDPGYIKGYVAGVRENGGQYTHAAGWVVRAVAESGDRNRAARLLEMLAPISHSLATDSADQYRVEPFAVAADIYGATPHIGRGGWTWYTGSSGWLYRVAIESILGIRIENGDTLVVSPCVPDEWPGFRAVLHNKSVGKDCEIVVENPNRRSGKIAFAEVNGQRMEVNAPLVHIPLTKQGGVQQVRLVLG
ncbi:GH36-type glycosyl hydrolase domain-containing protein [Planctomicrobium piriforme]|uniref:Cyclic beta-1,2-glucan synthetase n=1 Tax=Planctomicrobium piriforme TaxID=1576369 RepID=A0A1I3B5A1_9PLAN|nr:glycosyl transferase [Planctomicrobium piriforme]SFH57129.1 cyclic beta-1,2-glucan synthetase [Planctomicrobium piriforme]